MSEGITLEALSTKRLADTVQELSLARDLQSVMQIIRTVARQLTGADGATFVLRDGDFCYYADEDAISPLWKGSRFPIETCITGIVMNGKKPVVIEDVFADDRVPTDVYKKTFVKSMVAVPIRKMDPIGAIGNYWADYRKPTAGETAVLQALADITAVSIENIEVRNELQNQLAEQGKMLEKLEKQKQQMEEFTQIIAHNMRSPLSNIMLLNSMIEDTEDVEEKLLYVSKQKPVVEFLRETFEELVDAIKVKKDFSVKSERVDLEKCFQKTISLLQGDITETGADISADFTKAPAVYFPLKYMDSILFNLLSNALKYRSRKRKPVIEVRSFKDEQDHIRLEVRDNGLGIDLKQHGHKIFKLHKTFHGNDDAKGFGLFITKTQVEAQGGDITVQSKPGEGSVFTVEFPDDK